MRSKSLGDLYPITSQLPNATHSPSSFATFSLALWHNHLGHLDPYILGIIYQNNLISCNKYCDNFICHSYPLGKQTKLPFIDSLMSTALF